MPLVLVQNEVTASEKYAHWKDVTGEQYHFPNQYIKKIRPGVRFVYYHGTRRSGGKRGKPEYFGRGVIGEVRLDPETADRPKRNQAYFCEILDYVPFRQPVSAKQKGKYVEDIPQNFWGVGVRWLSAETHQAILNLAGLPSEPEGEISVSKVMPGIAEVQIPDSLKEEPLLIPIPRSSEDARSSGFHGWRSSKNSTCVGNRAEDIVFRFLKGQLPPEQIAQLRWVAEEGETPGWDIEYLDENGKLVAVEVKGTSAPAFSSIEVTAKEWEAAKRLRHRYSFYLVADCLSLEPKIQAINNPFKEAERRALLVQPIRWRLTHVSE